MEDIIINDETVLTRFSKHYIVTQQSTTNPFLYNPLTLFKLYNPLTLFKLYNYFLNIIKINYTQSRTNLINLNT